MLMSNFKRFSSLISFKIFISFHIASHACDYYFYDIVITIASTLSRGHHCNLTIGPATRCDEMGNFPAILSF